MNPVPADIGIILVGGLRSHQENYAAAFVAAGCRLLAVGLAEGEDPARHAALANQFDVPMRPLAEAVHLPGACVASIAVGMHQRRQAAETAAQAGLHLYLDKPLAGSPLEAAGILRAVSDARVRAQVFSHVSAGWVRRAREVVRSGRIGRVLAVHADMLMAKGTPADMRPSPRRESAFPQDFPDDVAKRELTDMGIYPVSLVGWLLGVRATSVNAATANHFFAEHLDRDVEDYGAMLVTFEDGVIATITCGRTGWDSMPGPFLARVVIVGDSGSVVLGSHRQQVLTLRRPGAEPRDVDPADPMGMWLSTQRPSRSPPPMVRDIALGPAQPHDVAAFVSTLTAGTEQGISVAEAVHHCEILAAAYRSAAEGGAVAVAAQSSEGPR